MNAENLLQPLNNLLTQAQMLLTLSQSEEWESMQIPFADYQQQMSLLADGTYLQALKAANLADEAQQLILQLQDLNRQLDEGVAQIHANIASELRQIAQADKAINAYRR